MFFLKKLQNMGNVLQEKLLLRRTCPLAIFLEKKVELLLRKTCLLATFLEKKVELLFRRSCPGAADLASSAPAHCRNGSHFSNREEEGICGLTCRLEDSCSGCSSPCPALGGRSQPDNSLAGGGEAAGVAVEDALAAAGIQAAAAQDAAAALAAVGAGQGGAVPIPVRKVESVRPCWRGRQGPSCGKLG